MLLFFYWVTKIYKIHKKCWIRYVHYFKWTLLQTGINAAVKEKI